MDVTEENASVAFSRNDDGAPIIVSQHDINEPPIKKSRKSDDSYPFAKLRGVKIFSVREISRQDAPMTREYWTFWNETAEELCSDGAYNDWGKRDIKLYIDAAWVIHKTQLLEPREKEVRDHLRDLKDSLGSLELPVKLRTEDENVTELLTQLQDSSNNLTELNLELSKCRGKVFNLKQRAVSTSFTKEMKQREVEIMTKTIAEKEKNLYEGMAEVKKDQDSLKKSLNKLGNIIEKTKRNSQLFPAVILDETLQPIEATIITT